MQTLKNPRPLRSVYAQLPGGEPVATVHVDDYTAAIDFMMHSEGLLPLEVLEAPSMKPAQPPFVPNATHPSDHLDLFARFAFAS